MSDVTKSYPLAETAPTTNDFFKPESGPAIKQLEDTRQETGTPQKWGRPMKNNYGTGDR